MTNWFSTVKSGRSWAYNQNGFRYNETPNSDSDLKVNYNSTGTSSNWSNQSKS